MSLIFSYHEENVLVKLNRRKNSRRLRLTITPQGEIHLSAPIWTADCEISSFLQKHKRWIKTQLERIHANKKILPPTSYTNGSQHPFLGQPLSLFLQKGGKTRLNEKTQSLHLTINNPLETHIIDRLNHWYRQQAQELLPIRTQAMMIQTPWVEKLPKIKIRRMKRQWGSCTNRGHLTFNTHLIKAKPELIDHVILHELCHLAEFNHSKRFYALMSSIDDNWQNKQERLNKLTCNYIY